MTTKCLAIAAVLSLAAATRLTTAQAAALRDAPGDCVTDYKLCKDNSELVGNWEYQGKPGMTVRFLCLREAGRMGHKGLPPYAFNDIWTQVAMKGRDFVDTAVVRLTNHGMTCVVDLDAETVSVTADATADRPWCRDDYRVCADNNEVYDHYMAKDADGKAEASLDTACQDEAKRRGYGNETDFAYYSAPGRTWIDSGIARLPENADPSALLCIVDLKMRLVKSITQTGPRSLRAD
jgi:hypothetical protein